MISKILTLRGLCLVAVAVHFFGREIVDLYVDFLGSKSAFMVRMIPRNEYYGFALIQMGATFFLCLLVARFTACRSTIQEIVPLTAKKVSRGLLYYALLLIVMVYAVHSFASVNWSFNPMGRGVDQFDRGLSDAMARFRYLLFPIVSFLWFRYKLNRMGLAVVFSYFISLTLLSISNGDRRDLLFIAIFALSASIGSSMMKNIQGKAVRYRKYLVAVSIALLSAYFFRFDGLNEVSEVTYFALAGTIGSLGAGGITWHVLEYAEHVTGYLLGASFLSYFLGLFVPSVVLYVLGGSEFYFRSAYLFNDLFNANPNQGYDFSMIADFWWNFGPWLGSVLFVVMFGLVYRFVSKWEQMPAGIPKASAVLLAYYFIAGQRSDFGFFLKGVVYSLLFLLVLEAIRRVQLRL